MLMNFSHRGHRGHREIIFLLSVLSVSSVAMILLLCPIARAEASRLSATSARPQSGARALKNTFVELKNDLQRRISGSQRGGVKVFHTVLYLTVAAFIAIEISLLYSVFR